MTAASIRLKDARSKIFLLNYFRNRGLERIAELKSEIGAQNYRELTQALNKAAMESLAAWLLALSQAAKSEKWTSAETLDAVLLGTYCSYVAMLENRNEIWPYEYMAFSRRIGELWEHFVKIPFRFPNSDIRVFVPPLFSKVRADLKEEIRNYIDALKISVAEKRELLAYYEKVWLLVDSGEISLELDLHVQRGAKKINIDLKSGFGSNEKGNTNRLLMVATIYKNLHTSYSCVLLVRAKEDQNNHYFKTLKRSGVWEALCGDEAYARIGKYTGFDLQSWVRKNIDWKLDLSPSTYGHFQKQELTDYLAW